MFMIARQVLLALLTVPETDKALRGLADTAIRISLSRTALRHDLMGSFVRKIPQ